MKSLTIVFGLAAVVFVAAACGDAGADHKAPDKPAIILRKPVPAEFKGKAPPAGFDMASADNIEAGKKIFHTNPPNCFNCHGETGKGDGSLGKDANPKPTDLTSAEFQTGVTDDYIYWRVSTGGVGGPQGTIMTGYPGATDEEIWKVVAYVRSLKGK